MTSSGRPESEYRRAQPEGGSLSAAALALRCRPGKAQHADECERLEQLPNVGPAVAADLRRIGVRHPRELATCDAFELYRALERAAGRRQDPCVLDTFLAATDFMRGAPARPWWAYTAERKRRYGAV